MNSGLAVAPAGRGTYEKGTVPRFLAFAVGASFGALLGAIPVLAANGLLQPAPPTVRAVALAVVGSALLVVQVRRQVSVLPQSMRQVPRTAVAEPGLVGPFQFGFELGTGARTYVSSVGSYALLAIAVLVPSSPLLIAVAALGFGVARGLHPLLFILVRSEPAEWHRADHLAGACMAILAVGLAGAQLAAGG